VSTRVLARAAERGFEAVVLTVDLPVAGRRERELRHGDVPLPEGAAFADHLGGAAPSRVRQGVGGWAASLTWADIAWAREASGLPVLVKGILTAEDARAALEAGAAGVVVSNHGARQLDGVVPTAVALREVAAEVAGRAPVLVDGGIRDGGDVVRALALGADAVLVGRPYVWGLATGGEAGVGAVLDALAADVARTLALVGCPTPADVTADRARLAGW
jgi:isopentenyl diphosphate isomerase/L-lactate dehydrogenase-like FMN-dependent dehydrogenase